jgi:hypothetical protein
MATHPPKGGKAKSGRGRGRGPVAATGVRRERTASSSDLCGLRYIPL